MTGHLEEDLKRARLIQYETHQSQGYMWATTTTSAIAATTTAIIGGGRWSSPTPPGIKEEKQHMAAVAGNGGLTELSSPAAPHGGHSPVGGMHSPLGYPPPSFADSIVFTTAPPPPPPNTTTSSGPGDMLYDTINMSQAAYPPRSSNSGIILHKNNSILQLYFSF